MSYCPVAIEDKRNKGSLMYLQYIYRSQNGLMTLIVYIDQNFSPVYQLWSQTRTMHAGNRTVRYANILDI